MEHNIPGNISRKIQSIPEREIINGLTHGTTVCIQLLQPHLTKIRIWWKEWTQLCYMNVEAGGQGEGGDIRRWNYTYNTPPIKALTKWLECSETIQQWVTESRWQAASGTLDLLLRWGGSGLESLAYTLPWTRAMQQSVVEALEIGAL